MRKLGSDDASWLKLESANQHLHICALARIDPTSMRFPYSFDHLKRNLTALARNSAWLRRKLFDSALNLDLPTWVEDPDFDIDKHFHRISLPAPGGEAELLELCGELASEPLDRSKPLWEMWAIEDLGSGDVAIFSKTHHAAIDPDTGTTLLSILCTAARDGDAPAEGTAHIDYGPPDLLELTALGAAGFVSRPLGVVRVVPWAFELAPALWSRIRRGARPVKTAPRTIFNGTTTGHRRIATATLDLADLKRVKRACDAKLNDVVLGVVALSLRMYLEDFGELPDDSLVAMVPVAVQPSTPNAQVVDKLLAVLHTDLDDPLRIVREIAAENAANSAGLSAVSAAELTGKREFVGASLFGLAMRLYAKIRLIDRNQAQHNLVITNVPGPEGEIYLLGARMTSMVLFAPVFPGAGLSISVLSLHDKVHIGIMACPELVPGLIDLAEACPQALTEMLAALK